MADWVGRASAVLEPIVDRMRALVLTGGKLHTDDTTVRVLESGKQQVRSSTGRFWAYLLDQSTADPPGKTRPLVVYDYTPSREAVGPQAFLEGYEGYLQADAYPGYQTLYGTGKVHEVSCWAHARRYFEALLGQPSPIAVSVVARIGELYRIERDIVRGPESHAERAAARQTHAQPVLRKLKAYIDAQLPTVPAKSAIAEAMGYVINRWASLLRYCEHGALSIDNNAVERSIRAGYRAQELDVRGQPRRWPPRGQPVQPDQHLQAERHRPIRVSARRHRTNANAFAATHRRTGADSLVGSRRQLIN